MSACEQLSGNAQFNFLSVLGASKPSSGEKPRTHVLKLTASLETDDARVLGQVGLHVSAAGWGHSAATRGHPTVPQHWKSPAQHLYIPGQKGNGKIKINLEGKYWVKGA